MTSWARVPIDDPRLAGLSQLPRSAAARTESIVIEGELALRRALEAGHRATLVVATPACADRLGELATTALAAIVDAAALSQLVGYEFHRGCIALVPRPQDASDAWRHAVAAVLARPHGRIVALDRIADAENVGAVIRSARVLGVDLVLLGRGCADPWSRRAVRASMGHSLAQPLFANLELVDVLAVSASAFPGLSWWSTGSVGETTPLRPWMPPDELPSHLGLVLGNEGDGVAAAVAAGCRRRIGIGTAAATDSLNVAAAAAILLWSLAAP